MAVIQCEIIAPESIQVGNDNVTIAGRTLTIYNVLDPASGWGVDRLWGALERSNFDFNKFEADGDFDDAKLSVLAGHTMDMILSSEPQYARKPVTQDEREKGIREGQIIKDAEGRDILLGYRVVGDLATVGPASVTPVNPY
jgi:hypothetical protein